MKDTYSLYEAKARLSALVRLVREGRRVVITVHGKPAAELRPVPPQATGIEARVTRLEELGVLTPAADPGAPIPVGARRQGALARFLKSRD